MLDRQPNDVLFSVISFLGGPDFALVSGTCRTLYKAVGEAAVALFLALFGKRQPRIMTRLVIFRMIEKARVCSSADARDLALWSATHNYPHTIAQLGNTRTFADIMSARRASDGATPLYLACERGHTDIVRMLVRSLDGEAIALRTTLINRGTKDGCSPLHAAAKRGNAAIAAILLSSPVCDIDSGNSTGETPLFLAAINARVRVVELLLNHDGADVDKATHVRGDSGGLNSLTASCGRGHFELVRRLLSFGANVHVRTALGNTPVITAAEAGFADIVQLLIDHGADIEAQTNSGKTAVYAAAENGHVDAVSVLMDANCCVSTPTYRNKTPLYAAAEQGFVGIVKLLLRRTTKQDLFTETTYGTTPLFIASKQRNHTVKSLLVDFCLQCDSKSKKVKQRPQPPGRPLTPRFREDM